MGPPTCVEANVGSRTALQSSGTCPAPISPLDWHRRCPFIAQVSLTRNNVQIKHVYYLLLCIVDLPPKRQAQTGLCMSLSHHYHIIIIMSSSLHYFYALLFGYYYVLLLIIITSSLHNYIMITSLLQTGNHVILIPLLRVVHRVNLHYYNIITYYVIIALGSVITHSYLVP